MDRIRGQWARERPELDTAAMGTFGRIYRIAAASGDRMTEAYAAFGITRADFDVLATLRRSGEPYALSPSALTATLMITSGGITGRVDRLARAGLVERLPDPKDRRGQLVSLTEEGRRLIDQAVPAGLAVQQELLARMPAPQRAELDRLLKELLALVE